MVVHTIVYLAICLSLDSKNLDKFRIKLGNKGEEPNLLDPKEDVL